MNPLIQELINDFPEKAKSKFLEVRSLVYLIAKYHSLGGVEETLKWGQPAYLCKTGSTVRIDWKQGERNQIKFVFNCKTTLVETFKEIFPTSPTFQGNRIVMVSIDKPLPPVLKTCLLIPLNYHRLKKRPLLGA